LSKIARWWCLVEIGEASSILVKELLSKTHFPLPKAVTYL
jgi:hypothetical protein